MDDRLGETELLGMLASVLGDAAVPEADLYVRRTCRGFARYAVNSLSQHAETLEDSATARVAVREGDGYKLASVSTTELSRDALVAALRRAATVARHADAVADWPGFAPPEGPTPQPPRYSQETARCSAADRAELVAPALSLARGHGLTAAGALDASVYEVAMTNTSGLARYSSGTNASFKMFALDPDGISGFSQATHRDVTRLEVIRHAERACEKSLAGRDPVALPAGEYDVILEPPAVAELLEWLSFIALGAREVADGTSALAGRTGETITGPGVTLVDDACDQSELGFGVPFDRDGVVRQRVVLIQNGVARGPVYDRLYAARLGERSTGHAAAPTGFGEAPIAQAVALSGGTSDLASLVAAVERGLQISRFHYVNGMLEPRRALMTGLTRDGTFLIEGGRRTRGVRNMRFTDSVLEAFARIDGLTAERSAVPTWWSEAGAFVAPSVLIRGFRFTGGGVDGTWLDA